MIDRPVLTGPHRVVMDDWICCAPFERLLNMDIQKAAEGHAILSMPFFMEYAQGAGLMHGGALVSLADTAVVMAIKSLIPPETHFATICLETRFLHPVRHGTVTAHASVERREGRSIYGRATIFDDQQRAVMEFSSVFKIAAETQINHAGPGARSNNDNRSQ
ncbi:hypothetical protein D3OALGA1CA_4853 [Olavius algarvensis associated proteobacterium Delta 3]|nr:hypothetical protein D3OALGB2SA_708 [Olavius algarvensis associated proteobacterium Delta 3]CAB5157903.1 hypothetical protein D3OALGA1CA_4853 [Olavius algarvensis associated proteobacterium Delta 3]